MTDPVIAADGVIVFMRSDSSECLCCDGRHVFARGLDGVNWHDAVWRELWKAPEGARVRILVEVVDES